MFCNDCAQSIEPGLCRYNLNASIRQVLLLNKEWLFTQISHIINYANRRQKHSFYHTIYLIEYILVLIKSTQQSKNFHAISVISSRFTEDYLRKVIKLTSTYTIPTRKSNFTSNAATDHDVICV